MSSSAIRPQTIVPWEMALLDELEDKPGDSVTVKMAKFDGRQHHQRLALQRELEAKEQRIAEEAERASTKVIVDVDDGDDEAMEDTPDVEMVSHPRVLRTLPPRKDSVAKVLDRRLGEVVKLLQKNNTAIATLAGDVRDLSGVLEESFKALKTMTTALVSRAQNAEDV
ncbi:hypothetical protein PISMIDRAFT_8608 [Pisolithus microcarpus 441]|uniref:Uncharacterized protein n=1 Tax=Pisolithus microcarpus 441 TaxID=765257 RepID=A0A0C9YPY8_9AGAM|nr:hypothetical protein PISMIDRAFT_8608 [Pisolithus microcarpus 441]